MAEILSKQLFNRRRTEFCREGLDEFAWRLPFFNGKSQEIRSAAHRVIADVAAIGFFQVFGNAETIVPTFAAIGKADHPPHIDAGFQQLIEALEEGEARGHRVFEHEGGASRLADEEAIGWVAVWLGFGATHGNDVAALRKTWSLLGQLESGDHGGFGRAFGHAVKGFAGQILLSA